MKNDTGLRRRWVVVAAVVLAGCSSEDGGNGASGGSAGKDAGGDGDAMLADAPADAPADANCSAPTPLEMHFSARFSNQPLVGASVTTIPCGTALLTDSAGWATLPVASNRPFSIAITDPKIVPQLVGEWSLSTSSSFNDSLLSVSEGQAIGASPTAAILIPRYFDVGVAYDVQGISVSIKDHPEAQVTYFDASWKALTGASSTDPSGHFAVGGLAEGFVEVVASKPGATVFASGQNAYMNTTGRVPVVNGFVSHIIVLVQKQQDGGTGDGGPLPPPPPAPPGVVKCGTSTCSLLTEQCCAPASGAAGATCQPTGTSCSEVTVLCDEEGDCASGEVCCGTAKPGETAKCVPASACSPDASDGTFVLCSSPTACPSQPATCNAAQWGYWVCM